MTNKKKQGSLVATLFIFLFFTAWWTVIQVPTPYHSILNHYFGGFYGIMALWGAIWGLIVSQKWGGSKSIMGKGILMFSLGLLLQEFGQLAYFYYIFFHNIEAPYPSIGDVGYFGSIPLYTYGAVLLAKASGVKLTLKSFISKIQAIIIPTVILFLSYTIFLKDYEVDLSHPVTLFLDFGYPLGQAIYISVALLTYLLTRKVLGGVMKSKILFVLFALFVQYLADFTFLYQISKGEWAAGGPNDFLYLSAYFVMSFALIQLSVESVRSKLS